MKNYILIFLAILLINCNSDDSIPIKNAELIGKWKLIEQLADPGDGSGVFNPIDSDRTIEFFSNGSVAVNGDLCYMSYQVGTENSGVFIELNDNDNYDGIITPNNCDFSETKVYYALQDSNLILWYQCIEGCGQKFVKI